jgi:hypothetical protein
MANPNPFDQFDAPWTPPATDMIIQPAPGTASGGRQIFVKPADTTFIPGTDQIYDATTGTARDIPGVKPKAPEGRVSYNLMSADQKTAMGLDPNQPYFMGSDGLPTLPNGAKAGIPTPDLGTARAHVSDILKNIDQATALLNAPLTTGLRSTCAPTPEATDSTRKTSKFNSNSGSTRTTSFLAAIRSPKRPLFPLLPLPFRLKVPITASRRATRFLRW